MSQTGELRVTEQAVEEEIVDLDFHLHIEPEKMYPYVEDNRILSQLEKAGPPWNSRFNPNYAKKHVNKGVSMSHGVAFNTEDIVEVKKQYAIDKVVVSPGTNLRIGEYSYPRVRNALASAYNDYLLNEVIDVNEGIYGAMIVPNWDVKFGTGEIERVGSESGIVAGQNFQSKYKLWGDINFDPLFDELTSLGLPLLLHIDKNRWGPQFIRESTRTYVESSISEHGAGLVMNMMNMIFTGVFDKYPDLNVVFQEAGHNWFAHYAWRADDHYQNYSEDLELGERFMDRGEKYLNKMPSEYMLDNIYTTTQSMSLQSVKPRSHVKKLLDVCHAGEMWVYSSDWPHVTTDPADWLFDLPIDEELRSKIAHENAEEILRFPEK